MVHPTPLSTIKIEASLSHPHFHYEELNCKNGSLLLYVASKSEKNKTLILYSIHFFHKVLKNLGNDAKSRL